jgi:hypothetical protein
MEARFLVVRRCAGRGLGGLGAGGEGESRADGHHLGMHGERRIGVVAAAHHLEGNESGLVRLIMTLIVRLRLRLQPLLKLGDGGAIQCAGWQDARLQSAAIEAWTIAVEALADDLAAPDDDGAVTIMQGR